MKYGPKGPLSPSLGSPCNICGAPLSVGDYTTFHRAASASRYVDDSPEVHWDCEHAPGRERLPSQ